MAATSGPTVPRSTLLVSTALACLCCSHLGAAAPTYTNADVKVLKESYHQGVRRTGTASRRLSVAEARFPMEVMTEPWVNPPIRLRLLPYLDWQEEYEQYFVRHTGNPTVELRPSILVMHYTAGETFASAYNTFTRGVQMSAGDQGTVYGHPSVHYMIDTDGQIYQLLPTNRRATGTYGVNHCALQIEMVAPDEAHLVNNPAQLAASFRLARLLCTTFNLPRSKVYGHYHVSQGEVPEYLDYADMRYPRSYPPSSARSDPGTTYMAWLQYYLQHRP